MFAKWLLTLAVGLSIGVMGCGSSSPGTPDSDGTGGWAASGGSSTGGSATGGSASGGSASGGSAGGGSAGVASGGEATAADGHTIDDMEDGNAQLKAEAGRNGYWYTGGDATPGASLEPPAGSFQMLELPAGDHGSSAFAAHIKAAGFSGWGSVLGCNFVEQLAVVRAYDASRYCGVSFSGKAAAAVSVRFSVPDVDTHPAGGVCAVNGAADQQCYDHFSASFAFTTAWKSYSVRLDELTQNGTGYHPTDGKLKPDQIYSLEWSLPGNGKTLEIFVDGHVQHYDMAGAAEPAAAMLAACDVPRPAGPIVRD